jgi:hypothetical protein
MERHEEGENLMASLARKMIKTWGADHPETIKALGELSDVHRVQGHFQVGPQRERERGEEGEGKREEDRDHFGTSSKCWRRGGRGGGAHRRGAHEGRRSILSLTLTHTHSLSLTFILRRPLPLSTRCSRSASRSCLTPR